MLWLGKKLFRLREKINVGRGLLAEDQEKPFLEHLEDLRQTLVRMIVALGLAMVIAYSFHERLVEVVEHPIRAAKVGWPQNETLPDGLSPEDWINVKKITRGLLDLPPSSHEVWVAEVAGEDAGRLRAHAEALRFHVTSALLPRGQREDFLRGALAAQPAVLESALQMMQRQPDSRLDFEVVKRGGDIISMVTLGVAEGFNTTIKLSLYAGIIMAFPFLLYFLLLFVLPGLKPEEKRVLWPSLAIGFGLFLVGVCFAYFVVLPRALGFFYGYTTELGWSADYRFSEYSSFVTQVTLIFGLGFELPVVVYALIRLGVISFSTMKRTRGYAVLIIAVVSAIITPTPDAGTMLALTVPLVVLYELCIWLAFFHERALRRREAREEAERRARREKANLAAAYTSHPEPEELSPSAGDSAHFDSASALRTAPQTDSLGRAWEPPQEPESGGETPPVMAEPELGPFGDDAPAEGGSPKTAAPYEELSPDSGPAPAEDAPPSAPPGEELNESPPDRPQA